MNIYMTFYSFFILMKQWVKTKVFTLTQIPARSHQLKIIKAMLDLLFYLFLRLDLFYFRP